MPRKKKEPGKTLERPGTNRGKPPIKLIDMEELDRLCEMQCTRDEIASWFGIDDETLEARIKEAGGKSFSTYFALKRGKGKISLRRRQFQTALGTETAPPNPTMLIWLGKQYLGQSDRMEAGITARRPILIDAACDELPETGGDDGAPA